MIRTYRLKKDANDLTFLAKGCLFALRISHLGDGISKNQQVLFLYLLVTWPEPSSEHLMSLSQTTISKTAHTQKSILCVLCSVLKLSLFYCKDHPWLVSVWSASKTHVSYFFILSWSFLVKIFFPLKVLKWLKRPIRVGYTSMIFDCHSFNLYHWSQYHWSVRSVVSSKAVVPWRKTKD